MEGAGDWEREAPQAQGDRQGPAGHAAGQDTQDLRQPSRLGYLDFSFLVFVFFFVYYWF